VKGILSCLLWVSPPCLFRPREHRRWRYPEASLASDATDDEGGEDLEDRTAVRRKGRPTTFRRRTRVRDVFDYSLSDFVSYLCYGDDESRRGADPNCADAQTGDTLLHLVALKTDVARLGILLFFGCNIHQLNREQLSPLQVATSQEQHDFIDYVKWIRTRAPAGLGDGDDERERGGSLTLGTVFKNPLNDLVYETTMERPRDHTAHCLVYDVRIRGVSGGSNPLVLKLVEDVREIKCLRAAAVIGSGFLVKEVDAFETVYPKRATARDFAETQSRAVSLDKDRWWALVMPAYACTLEDRLRRVDETGERDFTLAQVAMWCLGISEALKALQAAGVVHCDVSPRNILVDEDGISRLGDFGNAQSVLPWGILPSVCNGLDQFCSPFAAPEIQSESQTLFDCAVDAFGLGAVLHLVLSGKPSADFNYADISVAGDRVERFDTRLRLEGPNMRSDDQKCWRTLCDVVQGLLVPVGLDRMTSAVAAAKLRSALEEEMETQGPLALPPKFVRLWDLEVNLARRDGSGLSVADYVRRLKDLGDLYRELGNAMRARHIYRVALNAFGTARVRNRDEIDLEDTLLQLHAELNREEAKYNRLNELVAVVNRSEEEGQETGGTTRPGGSSSQGVTNPKGRAVYKKRKRGPGG
jgi:serine/threonine protein kinase